MTADRSPLRIIKIQFLVIKKLKDLKLTYFFRSIIPYLSIYNRYLFIKFTWNSLKQYFRRNFFLLILFKLSNE